LERGLSYHDHNNGNYNDKQQPAEQNGGQAA
jgi:hypothetical protein